MKGAKALAGTLSILFIPRKLKSLLVLILGSTGRAVDVKQRSIYRCRHPAGATPELPTSSLPHPFFGGGDANGQSTTAYPMSSTASGGVSKPKAARISRVNSNAGAYDGGGGGGGYEQYASSIGKAASTKGPRSSAPPIPVGGYGTPRNAPVMGVSAPASADRALAPPFERSINLQSRIVPVLRGGEPTNGFSAPRGGGSQTGSAYNSPRGSEVTWPAGQLTLMGGGGGESHSYSSLATVPIMAQSDPQALPDWTKLLKLLCPSSPSHMDSTVNSPSGSNTSSSPAPSSSSQSKPSLIPLAQILSHPYMSLTPQLFFAPTTTDAMRQEVLDGLPNEKVGVWNKVWAKKVLMSQEAAKRWGEIEEEQKREEEEAKREEEEEEEEEKEMKLVKEEERPFANGAPAYGHRSMIVELGGPSYEARMREKDLVVDDEDVEDVSLYEEEV